MAGIMEGTTILCCSSILWAKILASFQMLCNLPSLCITMYWISHIAGDTNTAEGVAIALNLLISFAQTVAAIVLLKGVEQRNWRYVAGWVVATVVLWVMELITVDTFWTGFDHKRYLWREFWFLFALPGTAYVAFSIWVGVTVIKDLKNANTPDVTFDFRTLKEDTEQQFNSTP